jgi:hypothetical protein
MKVARKKRAAASSRGKNSPEWHGKTKALFVKFGARVWRTTWGTGIAAREGYLVTNGERIPQPLAWLDDFAAVRMLLDAELPFSEVADFRSFPRGVIPAKIGENLLFPVNLRTGEIGASSDDDFAAGHYIIHPALGIASAFCVLSHDGLASLPRSPVARQIA